MINIIFTYVIINLYLTHISVNAFTFVSDWTLIIITCLAFTILCDDLILNTFRHNTHHAHRVPTYWNCRIIIITSFTLSAACKVISVATSVLDAFSFETVWSLTFWT